MTGCQRPDDENLVADGWTDMPGYAALIGSTAFPRPEPTPEKIGEHVMRMYKVDAPRSERLRARVEEIVKDKATAEKLKAWYPTWCKRATFSDWYLQAFNQPNVHLVDTDGKGIDSATKDGLVVAGKEYPIDVLVLSTGYRSPGYGNGSPVARSGVEIHGRQGKSLEDKWQNHGASTLHGVCSNGFPNLFFMGNSQQANTGAFTMVLEVAIEHVAHIVSQAEKRTGGRRAVVEVTSEAEEAWAMEILKGAGWFATVAGCTSGYITNEGEANKGSTDPMEMMKKARSSPWSAGFNDYIRVLEKYQADGKIEGFQVEPASA